MWLGLLATPALAGSPSDYPSLSKVAAVQKTGANDVAVIVAVEDYIFLPDVKGATANGNDWEKFFQDSLGVGTVHFMSNSQGTREELERFAKLAAANAKPGGTVWFVFIGHGAPAKNGAEGLLVGVDAQTSPESLYARGMPQQDLLNILQGGQQQQTVLIVDACFSGRAGNGDALVKAQPVVPTSIKPAVGQSTVVMTAARSDEFAGPLPGLDRPAFSYLLLGAMRGWAVEGGDVSAQSAQRYVERALRGIPGRMTQTPSLFGNGDVVLTRAVREKDPGVAAIMRDLAAKPEQQQATIGTLEVKPVVITKSNDGIPQLPGGLKPEGAINLSVDPEVLIARDEALKADANGQYNADGAATAWAKVATMGGNNPFQEEAATRAKQWAEFAQKQRDLAAQKESDYGKISKILPLESVNEETKVAMLQNYGTLYGQEDMVGLIRLISPADVRQRLCRPYLSSGNVAMQVSMPTDRDGVPFTGEVSVGGQVLGNAPGVVAVPSCADGMEVAVREVESGKNWVGSVIGAGSGEPSIVSPEYEDLVPYSIWHDYIWANSPSGPLLGVMFSQMNFPSEFADATRNAVRGNVEIGLGGFGSDVSLWFEPSMVLEQDGKEASYGYAGGGQLGRFTAGRFSFSPLRIGYQKYTDAELDGLEGFTGHAALRFHMGSGLQLRGDGGILKGSKQINGTDWDGYIWSVGGGLEYGHPIVSNAIGGVLSESSYSGDDWYEWSQGSITVGYQLQGGLMAKQPQFGTFVISAKGADSYDEGGYAELQVAGEDAGGLGTTNVIFRLGMAMMGDDNDFVFQYGFVAGYNGYGDNSYAIVGSEFGFGWQLFSQVSFNLYGALNVMSLFSEDATDEFGNAVEPNDAKGSPVAAYLRWVTPWNVYVNGGARYSLFEYESAKKFGAFGEVGYLWTFD